MLSFRHIKEYKLGKLGSYEVFIIYGSKLKLLRLRNQNDYLSMLVLQLTRLKSALENSRTYSRV